ncbi:MAG: hypothetical protein H6Q73_4049 [Firmicutes bacterium]|nr:hypothetical protein [Bacillota bacterium]
MGFKENVLLLAKQFLESKPHIVGEEAAKTALIIPFMDVLGYNVFNPLEVKPEYGADFGVSKNKKVDYAIFKNDVPIIFIEAKAINEKLDNHDAQLGYYFNATPTVKIAILTNGLWYKFFTDLKQPNIMDGTPFFEIDFENIKDTHIDILAQFSKEIFDTQQIVKFADELVCMSGINKTLRGLFENPSDEFIKFLIKDLVTSKSLNSKVIDQYRPLVNKCVNATLIDIISERIKMAPESKAEPPKSKEGSAVETPAGSNVEYTLNENPTNKRPIAFELEGDKVMVNSWIEMLLKTVEILYRKDTVKMKSFVTDEGMNGHTVPYFSLLPQATMRKPIKIPNAEFYVETNRNADSIRKSIVSMLERYGIGSTNFKIYLRADSSE